MRKKLSALFLFLFTVLTPLIAESNGKIGIHKGFWWWTIAILLGLAAFILIAAGAAEGEGIIIGIGIVPAILMVLFVSLTSAYNTDKTPVGYWAKHGGAKNGYIIKISGETLTFKDDFNNTVIYKSEFTKDNYYLTTTPTEKKGDYLGYVFPMDTVYSYKRRNNTLILKTHNGEKIKLKRAYDNESPVGNWVKSKGISVSITEGAFVYRDEKSDFTWNDLIYYNKDKITFLNTIRNNIPDGVENPFYNTASISYKRKGSKIVLNLQTGDVKMVSEERNKLVKETAIAAATATAIIVTAVITGEVINGLEEKDLEAQNNTPVTTNVANGAAAVATTRLTSETIKKNDNLNIKKSRAYLNDLKKTDTKAYDSFKAYTGEDNLGNYHIKNTNCRNGYITNDIRDMDRAFDYASLPAATRVTRGSTDWIGDLRLDYDVDTGTVLSNGEPLLIGTKFSDKAFCSVTRDPQVSEKFARDSMWEHNGRIPIVEIMNMPKGTRALDASSVSLFKGESEYIIGRGSERIIEDGYYENGILYIITSLLKS